MNLLDTKKEKGNSDQNDDWLTVQSHVPGKQWNAVFEMLKENTVNLEFYTQWKYQSSMKKNVFRLKLRTVVANRHAL